MERIQRTRAKGYKTPPNTMYVGRPTKWGNKNKVEDFKTIELCLDAYRIDTVKSILEGKLNLEELRGKNLSCWCNLKKPCHVDVLIELLK